MKRNRLGRPLALQGLKFEIRNLKSTKARRAANTQPLKKPEGPLITDHLQKPAGRPLITKKRRRAHSKPDD